MRCLTCNGTGEVCNACGEAVNLCDCEERQTYGTVPCADCRGGEEE